LRGKWFRGLGFASVVRLCAETGKRVFLPRTGLH
jgi:hypothetical protein